MLHPYTNKTKVFELEKGMGCRLAITDYNEVVKLFIAAEGEITSHVLPVHVTFFVIQGEGTALVGKDQIDLSKGDVLEVEPHLSRAWKNKSGQPLEILVIKQL